MVTYIIKEKPYSWVCSNPCELLDYNKINELYVNYEDLSHIFYDERFKINYVRFNLILFRFHWARPINDDNEFIGQEVCYTDPEGDEVVIFKIYNGDKPIEIEIFCRLINECDDENVCWFEHEGIKTENNGFLPKGSCLNNYNLVVEFELD
jgi:hypothetical protein